MSPSDFRFALLATVTCGGLLLASFAADAAGGIYTVGPHGLYATIQDGINQAVADGGGEVRVEQGLYFENLAIGLSGTTQLTISGGWNALFSYDNTYWLDPLTFVLPDSNTSLLYASTAVSARLTVSSIKFASAQLNSSENGATGAVEIVAQGNSAVTLSGVTIANNTTTQPAPMKGAGLYGLLRDNALLSVTSSIIAGNRIIGNSGNANAQGAGVYLDLGGNAGASLTDNRIQDNRIDYSSGGCQGAGVYVNLTSSDGYFADGNRLSGNTLGDCARRNASASYFYGNQTADIVSGIQIRHARWIGNPTGAGSGVDQVVFDLHADSRAGLYNSLIVGGDARGLYVNGADQSVVNISNTTIADNASVGLEIFGDVVAYNVISWANGTNFYQDPNAFSLINNCLFDVDPLFVSVAANNYRLRAGSPGIDAGYSSSKVTIDTDLDGLNRLQGGAIDIGAYEYGDDIFRDDFDAANY